MGKITLRQALSVLDKSSPYSVSTLRLDEPNEWLKIKNYLYVSSQIEFDFQNALINAKSGDLFFLCGSSGDGKSEILTRLHKQFENKIRFHLDATHSKKQHSTAVDCLNELFDQYKQTQCILAIGINIGMMQKFIKFGDQRHNDIKDYLNKFFEKEKVSPFSIEHVQFFDFEDYPRLDFHNNTITSSFVSEFIHKLTEQTDSNPFWKAYLNDLEEHNISAHNYKLLLNKTVQRNLIKIFGLIRLYNKQFLTPRVFVDFMYKLIVTEHQDGLIGNLFSSLDNDISEKIVNLDPNKIRNKEIDDFNLAYSTRTLSDEDKAYIGYLNQLSGITLSLKGLIQLAYLMKDDDNKYSSQLSNAFNNKEKEYYLKLIQIYNADEISSDDEAILDEIITKIFIDAIYKYVNRHLPKSSDNYIITRELPHYFISSKADIYYDFNWIKQYKLVRTNSIPIPLIINDQDPIIFNLDITQLALALKIHNGFLPNRQKQDELSQFEEFISEIIKKIKDVEDIQLVNKQDKAITKIVKKRSGYSIKENVI